MDCGDAGHILVSKHVAEDLEEYEHWRPLLRDLGACEVKHGVRVAIVNLYADEVGNPPLSKKFQALKKHRARLRWVAITAVLLALAVIVAGMAMFSHYRVGSTLPAPEKSIAVLPFQNRSEDKANAYFADGIQDEILTRLSEIADLKVISRTSTQQYQSKPGNAPLRPEQVYVFQTEREVPGPFTSVGLIYTPDCRDQAERNPLTSLRCGRPEVNAQQASIRFLNRFGGNSNDRCPSRSEQLSMVRSNTRGVFLVLRKTKGMKTKTVGLTLLLSVATAAMCFADNPTLGTWKLDESKSTFGDGAGKSTMVVWKKSGVWEKSGGEQKCTVDGIDAAGKKTHTVWIGKLDGTFYAITGDPQADQRSFKQNGEHKIDMVSKKDGKEVGHGTIVVAEDGKTRTVTSTMTNAKGEKVTSTLAYDKS
jgi:hypothetical protein